MAFAFGPHKILDRQSSGFVVVQHHLRLEVTALPIFGVHKFTRFFVAVLDVVSASSPLPLSICGKAFHRFIAGALQEVAGTAGLRHRVGHARCHDRIDESRFACVSGDDFAQTLACRGAVPASIAELVLALFGAQLGTFDDLLQHFRLLAANLHLAAFEPLVSAVVVERCAFQVLPHPSLTTQPHRFHHHGLTGARPPDIDCADVEDDPNQEAEERSRPQMHIYTLKHTAGFETHTRTHTLMLDHRHNGDENSLIIDTLQTGG